MRLRIERDDRGRRALVLHRDVEPLEGTSVSLWNTQIPAFWAANGLSDSSMWMPGGPDLADRVWVAERCIQLNAQQISTMPIEFHGPDGTEPAWVSAPDPNLFPNGICDAMFFIVRQIYGFGFSCQYVTDTYSNGFPRTWTVLDSGQLDIRIKDGSREYKYGGDTILNASRVVQIDRNPSLAPHGTSALRAFAQVAWGLLSAGNQSMTVSQGGIPPAVLKSQRKMTKEQAEDLQAQWMEATQRRNGAPPVLPPELDFSVLSFDPKDMALIETQEFGAKMIMAAFGVPSPLMNLAIQGGLTYQNPQSLGEMWWRFELRNLATRIANAFSAQMLPRGQWITVDAADTFAPLTELSDDDDEQLSQVAKASPAQQIGAPRPLTAIGGSA